MSNLRLINIVSIHKFISNLIRTRLQVIQSMEIGPYDLDPIFIQYICPRCGKELMDIITINSAKVPSFQNLAYKLYNKPKSILKSSPSCKCALIGSTKMKLLYTMFCAFNSRDNIDLQIHCSYTVKYDSKGIEVFLVSIDGRVEKLSPEKRRKIIGM